MNFISPSIPQVLVPLSSAPCDIKFNQNINLNEQNQIKSKKNGNKTKNNKIITPVPTKKSARQTSKSESWDSKAGMINDAYDFNQNLNKKTSYGCNEPLNNSNNLKNHNQQSTRTHTVFDYSTSNKGKEFSSNGVQKFKKPCNKEQRFDNRNQRHQARESKIKTSTSQPTMNGNIQDQTNISNYQPTIYEKYMESDDVQKGLLNKTLIQGKIRINQRSYEDAFITDPNGGGDIYVNGLKDRNRALNGDIVAIKLKEKYLWKILDVFKNEVLKVIDQYETSNPSNPQLNEIFQKKLTLESDTKSGSQEKKVLIDYTPLNFSKPDLVDLLDDNWFQKTGTVVSIIEKKNSRWTAGHLKLFPDRNKEWALFSPNDSRLPRIKIRMKQCPPDFMKNTHMYASALFVAQIIDIPVNSKYAIGDLKRCIGKEGDVEVETEAFLIENGIDFSEFKEEVIQSLPQVPWKIPEYEFSYRRDLRDLCIFTIDPPSARDLDDALHCIKLDENTFEIGVHIADVSFFVPENSPIDKCALERTTSVYLVQKVIPMLPRLLCEELCSLNPALDRLTFSVIWKIDSNGNIISEWFGRTIINSTVKLSYEHAQQFIENPNGTFNPQEFPDIRPKFSLNDIKESVLNMDKIAKSLRRKRYLNGALALNQTKISFVLNKEIGMPYGYNIYQQKDSNRLVEEFMLLANIAVAHRIYDKYPNKAILRRHPQPNSKQIEQVAESIATYGFDCDIKSSGSIQTFLNMAQQTNPMAAITLTCLLTKTMQLAQYFCSGFGLEKAQFAHYGLAVPLYTHFTSPIRRYPDILVHRLLAASLGYCEESTRIPAHLNFITENCNDKKYSARVCSERSSEMFFSLFVNECGPFDEEACVIGILDHSFDILLVRLGFVKRIYTDKLDIVPDSVNFVKDGLKQEISFKWNKKEEHSKQLSQTIRLFSTVNVILMKHDNDRSKINIVLKHPNECIDKTLLERLEGKAIDHKEFLYNQRVDIDPYMCD